MTADEHRERQRAGIERARAAGKYKGRKPRMTPEVVLEARIRLAEGARPSQVAREIGVDRVTLWRALNA